MFDLFETQEIVDAIVKATNPTQEVLKYLNSSQFPKLYESINEHINDLKVKDEDWGKIASIFPAKIFERSGGPLAKKRPVETESELGDDFITIYLKPEKQISHEEFLELEKLLGREVSDGSGFINIYTADEAIIQKAKEFIGPQFIEEVSLSSAKPYDREKSIRKEIRAKLEEKKANRFVQHRKFLTSSSKSIPQIEKDLRDFFGGLKRSTPEYIQAYHLGMSHIFDEYPDLSPARVNNLAMDAGLTLVGSVEEIQMNPDSSKTYVILTENDKLPESVPVNSNFFAKEALKNDFNGKVKKLKEQLPAVFKGIMNSDVADRFQGGINDFEKLQTSDGKTVWFIDEPGHGWYFDEKGVCIGEEDGGFYEESGYAQYNSERQQMHQKNVSSNSKPYLRIWTVKEFNTQWSFDELIDFIDLVKQEIGMDVSWEDDGYFVLPTNDQEKIDKFISLLGEDRVHKVENNVNSVQSSAFNFSDAASLRSALKEFFRWAYEGRIENDANDPDFDPEMVGSDVEDQLTGIAGEINGKKVQDLYRELTKDLTDAQIKDIAYELPYIERLDDGWAYYDAEQYRQAVEEAKGKKMESNYTDEFRAPGHVINRGGEYYVEKENGQRFHIMDKSLGESLVGQAVTFLINENDEAVDIELADQTAVAAEEAAWEDQELFNVSMTYSVIDPGGEAIKRGEPEETGFEWEDKQMSARDIIQTLKNDIGYYENLHPGPSMDLYGVDPDKDHQTGTETRYALHISGSEEDMQKLYEMLKKGGMASAASPKKVIQYDEESGLWLVLEDHNGDLGVIEWDFATVEEAQQAHPDAVVKKETYSDGDQNSFEKEFLNLTHDSDPNYIESTGEEDQDYDVEAFDKICEELKKYGFQCEHREFDKYQGIYLNVTKVGKSIKYWVSDYFVTGESLPNTAKYREAYLIGPDGEKSSANSGDYFQMGDDEVFTDTTLVLIDHQGEKTEIETPKKSDLPDLLDVSNQVQFEGEPDEVYVLDAEGKSEEEDPVMVTIYSTGDVDASELILDANKRLGGSAEVEAAGGKWIIKDWAGNEMFGGKSFKSFDDAEEFLSKKLGDDYETDRQEYEIIESSVKVKSNYIMSDAQERFNKELEQNTGVADSIVKRAARAANSGHYHDRIIGIAKAIKSKFLPHLESLKDLQDKLNHKPQGLEKLHYEIGNSMLFQMIDDGWTKEQLKQIAWGLPYDILDTWGLVDLRTNDVNPQQRENQ